MDEFGLQEAPVERPLLLSGQAAARLLGVDPGTFRAIAEENSLQPVSTGRRRLWKRADLQRLAGLRTEETA